MYYDPLEPKQLGILTEDGLCPCSNLVSVRKGDGLAHVLPMILSSQLPSKQKPLNVSGDGIVSVRVMGLKGIVRLLRRVKAVLESDPVASASGFAGLFVHCWLYEPFPSLVKFISPMVPCTILIRIRHCC